MTLTTQWQLKLSNRVHFISGERWRRCAAAACSAAAHRSAVLQSACIRGDWRLWLFRAASFLFTSHITKWVFSFTPKERSFEQNEKYYVFSSQLTRYLFFLPMLSFIFFRKKCSGFNKSLFSTVGKFLEVCTFTQSL